MSEQKCLVPFHGRMGPVTQTEGPMGQVRDKRREESNWLAGRGWREGQYGVIQEQDKGIIDCKGEEHEILGVTGH